MFVRIVKDTWCCSMAKKFNRSVTLETDLNMQCKSNSIFQRTTMTVLINFQTARKQISICHVQITLVVNKTQINSFLSKESVYKEKGQNLNKSVIKILASSFFCPCQLKSATPQVIISSTYRSNFFNHCERANRFGRHLKGLNKCKSLSAGYSYGYAKAAIFIWQKTLPFYKFSSCKFVRCVRLDHGINLSWDKVRLGMLIFFLKEHPTKLYKGFFYRVLN